jgi:hypothetical protein
MLTTHLYPVPRLGMHEAISVLFAWAFKAQWLTKRKDSFTFADDGWNNQGNSTNKALECVASKFITHVFNFFGLLLLYDAVSS